MNLGKKLIRFDNEQYNNIEVQEETQNDSFTDSKSLRIDSPLNDEFNASKNFTFKKIKTSFVLNQPTVSYKKQKSHS